MNRFTAVIRIFAGAVLCAAAAHAAAWTIEPIVPANWTLTNVRPTAISNTGYIVGWGQFGANQTRSFMRFPNGNLILLGTLGGNTYATGVSDTGVVVGYSELSDGTPKLFTTTPDAGSMTAVPLPAGWSVDPASASYRALSIRPNGSLTGGMARRFNIISGTVEQAFVYNLIGVAGGVVSLPALPGYPHCRVQGMSATVSVGFCRTSISSSAVSKAYYVTAGGAVKNLGALPGDTYSQAVAVNGSGNAVGWSSAAGSNWKGFVSQANGGALVQISLPAPFSASNVFPQGINATSQVVGHGYVSGAVENAWLLSGGAVTRLGQLPVVQAAGWTVLSFAWSINDSGWIVGTGTLNGVARPYLLKP